jgi:hypothetical protein
LGKRLKALTRRFSSSKSLSRRLEVLAADQNALGRFAPEEALAVADAETLQIFLIKCHIITNKYASFVTSIQIYILI